MVKHQIEPGCTPDNMTATAQHEGHFIMCTICSES